MTPELRAKWVAALRSGRYRQTQSALKRRRPQDTKPSYCCLGVLCTVAGKRSRRESSGSSCFEFGGEVAYLSPDLLQEFGLTDAQQKTLARLNDRDEKTFEEIADYIETNIA